jgi:hypothetical protein
VVGLRYLQALEQRPEDQLPSFALIGGS